MWTLNGTIKSNDQTANAFSEALVNQLELFTGLWVNIIYFVYVGAPPPQPPQPATPISGRPPPPTPPATLLPSSSSSPLQLQALFSLYIASGTNASAQYAMLTRWEAPGDGFHLAPCCLTLLFMA